MRIHILYEFKPGPWGGGNQFLKALKTAFTELDIYEETIEKADVVLFNSHHFGDNYEALDELYEIRQSNPKALIIHRVDGPIQIYRGADKVVDKIIFKANTLLADATIFQTQWSKESTLRLGLKPSAQTATILNAPDSSIFYPAKQKTFGGKVKLIATSFSANKRKGFDIYEYLDRNLDFERFEMVFVGNSLFEFENIKHVNPLDSHSLAELLRQSDVFVTASQHDPCSNSLIEALHCTLPALVRNSGGHHEIIDGGGVVFEGTNDILGKLNLLVKNYDDYKTAIDMPSIFDIAQRYVEFIADVQHEERVVVQKDIELIKNTFKRHAMISRVKSGIKRRLGLAS